MKDTDSTGTPSEAATSIAAHYGSDADRRSEDLASIDAYSVVDDDDVNDREQVRSKLVEAVEENHRVMTEKITEVVRQSNEAVREAGKVVVDVSKRTDKVINQIGKETREVSAALQKVADEVQQMVSEDGVLRQAVNETAAVARTVRDAVGSMLPDMTDDQKRTAVQVSVAATVVAVTAAIVVGIMRRNG